MLAPQAWARALVTKARLPLALTIPSSTESCLFAKARGHAQAATRALCNLNDQGAFAFSGVPLNRDADSWRSFWTLVLHGTAESPRVRQNIRMAPLGHACLLAVRALHVAEELVWHIHWQCQTGRWRWCASAQPMGHHNSNARTLVLAERVIKSTVVCAHTQIV